MSLLQNVDVMVVRKNVRIKRHYETRGRVGKGTGASIPVIVFLIAVAAVLFVYTSSPTQKTADSSSTIVAPSLSAVPPSGSGFLYSYAMQNSPARIITYANITFDNSGSCQGIKLVKWFAQPGINVTYTYANFSSFNQSAPLAQYVALSYVNPANASAYAANINQSGLCPSTELDSIFENSAHNYSTVGFDGIILHVYNVYNFTNTGMHLTNNYYVGKKPDIYWYFATTAYKGTGLQFGSWGYSDSETSTALLSQAEAMIGSYINADNGVA